MQKENEVPGNRAEYKEVERDSAEAQKYGYKKELNLTAEELVELGDEFGFMRFVRFNKGSSQTVVIEMKIDGNFPIAVASSIKDQPEALSVLKQVVTLAESFNKPGGEVLEQLLKMRVAYTESDGPCMCPKCVEKRAHVN